jgi:tripartite-type tricarboxylate transporter receptor subunit TctC
MTDRMLLAVLSMMAAAPLAGRSGSGMQKESAEEHPSDEIWVLVPHPVGGSTDLASRTIGRTLRSSWGSRWWSRTCREPAV